MTYFFGFGECGDPKAADLFTRLFGCPVAGQGPGKLPRHRPTVLPLSICAALIMQKHSTPDTQLSATSAGRRQAETPAFAEIASGAIRAPATSRSLRGGSGILQIHLNAQTSNCLRTPKKLKTFSLIRVT